MALGLALVRPRRLLILDEPEQRLDKAGRRWLSLRLLAEKSSGTAILLASHDPSLVDTVADGRLELGPTARVDADYGVGVDADCDEGIDDAGTDVVDEAGTAAPFRMASQSRGSAARSQRN